MMIIITICILPKSKVFSTNISWVFFGLCVCVFREVHALKMLAFAVWIRGCFLHRSLILEHIHISFIYIHMSQNVHTFSIIVIIITIITKHVFHPMCNEISVQHCMRFETTPKNESKKKKNMQTSLYTHTHISTFALEKFSNFHIPRPKVFHSPVSSLQLHECVEIGEK